MNILPRHQRVDDPPDKNRMEWRLWLALQKYPIQVALFLALLVLAVPVTLLLNDNSSLRAAVRSADHQRLDANRQRDTLSAAVVRLDAAIAEIQSQRHEATLRVCNGINALTGAIHTENVYLGTIITNGARQSKPFDKIYRQFGLPPYSARLKQAERLAHGILRNAPHAVNCQQEAASSTGYSTGQPTPVKPKGR